MFTLIPVLTVTTIPRPMRRFCGTLLPFLVIGFALMGCDSGTGVPGDVGDETGVSFATANDVVVEDDGSYTVEIEATDPGHKQFSVDVNVDEQSTATLGEDVSGVSEDTTLTFPESTTSGETRSLSLEIVDDRLQEENKELVFSLTGVEGSGVSLGEQSTFTLTIQNNDLLVVDFADEELAPMMAYSVASNEDWEVSSEGDPPNAPYVVANGFQADEASNDWLITPAINLEAYQEETLTFLNAKNFEDSEQRGLQVWVSTTYDGESNPEDFSWTEVSDQVSFSDGNYEFVESGDVNLSGEEFQGSEVYVAFQYESSGPFDAATWQVDDIHVTGTPSN